MNFFFLFKNACWYKHLARSNVAFWEVSMGLSLFYLTKCFICILYSILLLLTILFLLFTIHFYDKDLALMAFVSLHADSINIKGSFFSKFSHKCRTIRHVRMFFCSLLFFISVILLVLSGDIETNPGPDPGYSNSYWNLNSIAFEKLLTCLNSIKPHMLLVTGDFNVRSSSWWSDDIEKIEGTRLESITSYYGLYQITNESTHILSSSSSCIDLIFTN